MTDLPECKYRRYTRRPGVLRLHCFLKRGDCSQEECQECPYAIPEVGLMRKITFDDGTAEVGYFSETPDSNHWVVEPTWIVNHSPITFPEPKKQKIKKRRFTVESNGAVVYEQEDWEPPRDMNGYQRDPKNLWRFIPLWPKCIRRQPRGKYTKGCGCIEITMKCDNPDAALFKRVLTPEQCQLCERRIEA